MNVQRKAKRVALASSALLLVAGLSATSSSAAVVPITLGKAGDFSLIVGGGLINSGQSSLSGDLALTPVISYSDSGLLTVKGDYHFGDSKALDAQRDATAAYNVALNETPAVTVGSEFAGLTLSPGIYSNAAGISVNGVLSVDAQNNPNALFIFQTPAALTTGAASKINLMNGAQACNIFWQVGTTSTLGASSDFKGNLLSRGAFVSSAGSTVTGRVLVTQGSATLNSTQIIKPECKVVKPVPTNNFGTGGGSYNSQYGKASYNFVVRGVESSTGVFTNITGKAGWSVSKAWNFSGTPTAYTYLSGVGTITGTGSLQYYARAKQDGDKRWLAASSSPVTFTIKYTRVTNGDGSLGRVSTFAIGFTGTPVSGVPSLPALGALVQVKGGEDNSKD